jgi:hypothetical protein
MIMKKQKKVILGVCVCAVFAAVVFFVPAMLQAGSLEPSGSPAPTMKTLDQIPPTWSEKITTGRFIDALGGAAVLDRETGLVWEKSPSQTTKTWGASLYECYGLEIGGRKGWHLPTIEQLMSLVDTSVSGSPKLPSGHPFDTDCTSGGCVGSNYAYYSATQDIATTHAYLLFIGAGTAGIEGKDNADHFWCVRGGQSDDPY